jgi:hypothetical protein
MEETVNLIELAVPRLAPDWAPLVAAHSGDLHPREHLEGERS